MATIALKLGGNDTNIATAIVTYDPANETTYPDGSLDINACEFSGIVVTIVGGPVTISIWRKQGSSKTPWKTQTLGVGVHLFQSGGPVKIISDIETWHTTVI